MTQNNPLNGLYDGPPYLVRNESSRKYHVYEGGESCACGNVQDFTISERVHLDAIQTEDNPDAPIARDEISKGCWDAAMRFHLCMSCGQLRPGEFFEEGDSTCRVCNQKESHHVVFRESEGSGYVVREKPGPLPEAVRDRVRDALVREEPTELEDNNDAEM